MLQIEGIGVDIVPPWNAGIEGALNLGPLLPLLQVP
jgi:hypothetical protein